MVLPSLLAANGANAALLGVTWDGNVVSIDVLSGAGTLVGLSGFDRLNSLGVDGAGRFVAGRTEVNINSTESEVLFLDIDPTVGEASQFAATILPGPQSLRALAFASDGELFLATRPSEPGGSSEAFLWRLEKPGAEGAMVGSHGPGLQGLTFANDGTLYGWHIGVGLVIVDPRTALLTDVNGIVDGTPEIQSIAFGPDGTLYGAREALFTIDLASGVRTQIGVGSLGDVRGIAWIPQAVPPCPWDLNGDGVVNVLDLIELVMSFGPCEGCPADFDDDGFVNVLDLIALIMNFGPCPGTECVWDVNGDGIVDQSDVVAVTSNMGPCDGCPEDINGDGVVNGQDAAAVATHFGPCP